MNTRIETLVDRLAAVRRRIGQAAARVGRDPSEITLVLVTKEAPDSIFAEAARVANARGVALRLPSLEEPSAPREAGTPGCDWPWRSAHVRADGQVQPCCMLMGGDRAILGDAGRAGLDTVWRSEAYEAFRAALTSATPPDVCAGCAMYRRVF